MPPTPISQKKLAMGDGQWSTKRTVLGWNLDTIAKTITLPQHRADRLCELLATVPSSRTCISRCHWHQLISELRSMTLALPGSRGLFSTLQEAFRHSDLHGRIHLHQATHDFLNNFRWLAATLHQRPNAGDHSRPSYLHRQLRHIGSRNGRHLVSN